MMLDGTWLPLVMVVLLATVTPPPVVGDLVVVAEVVQGRLLLVVRPAVPALRDRGVRGVVDLVVADRVVRGVPAVDGDAAEILDRRVEHVVVGDGVVARLCRTGRGRHVH